MPSKLQVNSDMTDSVGQENWSVICKCVCYCIGDLIWYIYKSQNSEIICLAGFLLYMYLSAEKYKTVRTECCLAERNSAHVLVLAGIRWLLDTCLSGIHNANYIVNSIVCAMILVHGSHVPAYKIRPMHDPIHILDMHGTGTKDIVRHIIAKSLSYSAWSGIAKFTCILITRPIQGNCSQMQSNYLADILKCSTPTSEHL